MENFDLSTMFNTDQLLLSSAFSWLQILLSLSMTFLMAMFVFYVYKKTYSGVLYSKNFNMTLVMTALVVDAIMMGISGNIILSLGLVGALSIVRFRTAVKDPKDTAFLFWAITIGVINGVAYYQLSILASIFIALTLIFLSSKSGYEPSYVLILKYRQGDFSKIEPVLKTNLSKFITKSDVRSGEMIEKVIEVSIDSKDHERTLSEIRNTPEVVNCTLVAAGGNLIE